MTSVIGLIFTVAAYLVGILSILAAYLYVRLCFLKPGAAIAFEHEIVTVEKGVGYCLEMPLGIYKLESSNLSDHGHRRQRCVYWLNHLLVWLGFALPIYFTVTGFLQFGLSSFRWQSEAALTSIFPISFLCGAYLANKLLFVAKQLAKYQVLTAVTQDEGAEENADERDVPLFGKDYFRATEIFRK